MAFTEEAITQDPSLVSPGEDRVWEVWDEPPVVVPDVVVAFRLVFPTSELGVKPDQRTTKNWRKTVFIEAAPDGSGNLTVVTLFVTKDDPDLRHASQPSFRLASLPLAEGRRVQLVAHADPERDLPQRLDEYRKQALESVQRANIEVPTEAYLYLFGKDPDGARFIVGAWAAWGAWG